jgi:hypothetical protein
MFLKLYSIGANNISVVPARRGRQWMKGNPHAFRCGPLANFNAFGWDLVINDDVQILWDGGPKKEALTIEKGHNICHSNFGHGVLTFVLGYTWHTSPGWSLAVSAVPNNENDDWSTIWALIETDSLKYPFFPSVQFKKPGRWTIKADTAIARVFPIQQQEIMDVQPVIEREPSEFLEYRRWQTNQRNAGGYKVQKFYKNVAEYPVVKMKEPKDERSVDNTQLPDEPTV